jgi:hypothetical protein
MAENNTIFFKLEEYYDNDGSEELQASTDVSGKVNISVINLLNKETAADQPREVVGLTPLSRYTINDTTENLFSVSFITDDDGYTKVDLSKMLLNTTFIKFYQKYKGEVTLNVTIEIPKTDKYNVFVGNAKITPSWKKEESGIIFESYDYYNNDDTIILSPIEDKVTDLATLRQTYKTVEENYLLVKKRYESQIVGEVDLEIDTTETYEPKSLKTVITRLLEFQVGTLQPALEYTKTAKLTTEYDRLNTMDKLVNILSKMYPNITIEDGEGIPYNSDIDPKLETL